MTQNETKTFTLKIEIQNANTPQNWVFSKNVSGIEQLAIWTIVENLSKQQKQQMLNLK